MGRLSVTGVKAASRPGKLGDGDGLFLVVSATGAKSWVCRVQKRGRRRDIGLGSAKKVSLALARERAREVRTWMAVGIPTFREATAVLALNKKTWRNEKQPLGRHARLCPLRRRSVLKQVREHDRGRCR